MKMREIINGINIEYLLTGKENRETILFVHGLGADLTQFENQHKFLQNKYKILSLSLRGHGNTTSINDLTEIDFELYKLCQDIIELLNRLEIKKVHFVGNSMGGNIGYELLKSNQNRLLSFTTFGTTAEFHKSRFTVGLMKLAYKVLSIKAIGKLSKAAGATEYSRNKIFDMISQTPKSTIINIIPYLAKFNYIKTIKKNKIPSLIIKGDKDKAINKDIGLTIKTFCEKNNFRLVEMKNTGHFANLDNPKGFNQILNSFICSL